MRMKERNFFNEICFFQLKMLNFPIYVPNMQVYYTFSEWCIIKVSDMKQFAHYNVFINNMILTTEKLKNAYLQLFLYNIFPE